VGLNEFAGYLVVGVTAYLTGLLSSEYGLRPAPIYLGVVYAVLGAALSIFLVRDTREHVRLEASSPHPPIGVDQLPRGVRSHLLQGSQSVRRRAGRTRQQPQ
jgi:hypothetical protein